MATAFIFVTSVLGMTFWGCLLSGIVWLMLATVEALNNPKDRKAMELRTESQQ